MHVAGEDINFPDGRDAVYLGADGKDENIVITPEGIESGFLLLRPETIDHARLDHHGGGRGADRVPACVRQADGGCWGPGEV